MNSRITPSVALFKRYPLNTAGKDYAVGDIHGYFSLLRATLDRIGFDPSKDRLFSVGDLVDRGPECEEVLAWLDKPWFHAIRGNHEDYACRYQTVEKESWIRNGGLWFQDLAPERKEEISARLRELPLVMEVATAEGPVGIVHADSPRGDWKQVEAALNERRFRDRCMWSRERVSSNYEGEVRNVRAVVVGHTPLHQPVRLGNVYHIDTAGWRPDAGGYFTLLDLATLETTSPLGGRPERRERQE